MMIESHRVYTPNEVSKLLSLTPRTVREQWSELGGVRVGNSYKILGSVLLKYLGGSDGDSSDGEEE